MSRVPEGGTHAGADAEGVGGDGDAVRAPEQSKPANRRAPRRAHRPGPVSSDTSPEDPVATTRDAGENDERLQADKPPHWG